MVSFIAKPEWLPLFAYFFQFFKTILVDISSFSGDTDALVLDFWWCLHCVSKPFNCVLCHLHAMDSSDSSLVRHKLTSWQPAWQPSPFWPTYLHTCLRTIDSSDSVRNVASMAVEPVTQYFFKQWCELSLGTQSAADWCSNRLSAQNLCVWISLRNYDTLGWYLATTIAVPELTQVWNHSYGHRWLWLVWLFSSHIKEVNNIQIIFLIWFYDLECRFPEKT